MADEPKRHDPTDFSQFRKPARKVDLAVVDSANESLGYSAPKPNPAPAPQRRLFRTGRNMQLNIKASADTVRRFIAISDAYDWPSGLTMEHDRRAGERACARKPTKGPRRAKPSRGVGRSWLVGETRVRALSCPHLRLAPCLTIWRVCTSLRPPSRS